MKHSNGSVYQGVWDDAGYKNLHSDLATNAWTESSFEHFKQFGATEGRAIVLKIDQASAIESDEKSIKSVTLAKYTPVETDDVIKHSVHSVHTGIILEWRGISLTVPSTKEDGSAYSRYLLSPMSGIARPGEVLAVMGTSGAGIITINHCNI